MVSEQELRRMITEWVGRHGQRQDSLQVDERTDLLASGALDSMGFIELLVYIESITGQKIDLSELDPSVFTSIHGLVHNIIVTNTKA